jgi:hypothetical protein
MALKLTVTDSKKTELQLQAHGMPVPCQEVLLFYIVRHNTPNQSPEGAVMIHMKEMTQLMDNNIIDNLYRGHGQTIIKG